MITISKEFQKFLCLWFSENTTKVRSQKDNGSRGKKGKKQGILKGRLENYISVEQKLRNSSVKQIVIEITVLQ